MICDLSRTQLEREYKLAVLVRRKKQSIAIFFAIKRFTMPYTQSCRIKHVHLKGVIDDHTFDTIKIGFIKNDSPEFQSVQILCERKHREFMLTE